jgi:hypothetical protein
MWAAHRVILVGSSKFSHPLLQQHSHPLLRVRRERDGSDVVDSIYHGEAKITVWRAWPSLQPKGRQCLAYHPAKSSVIRREHGGFQPFLPYTVESSVIRRERRL